MFVILLYVFGLPILTIIGILFFCGAANDACQSASRDFNRKREIETLQREVWFNDHFKPRQNIRRIPDTFPEDWIKVEH